MSTLEKRAWLYLWSLCPVYSVYFAIQLWYPALLPTMVERFACLAAAAAIHAVVYLAGLAIIKRGGHDDSPALDERDRAIDARATRWAYFVLLAGMIVAGMVMPFSKAGWELVNTALLFVVLSETVRVALVLTGYRSARLAW